MFSGRRSPESVSLSGEACRLSHGFCASRRTPSRITSNAQAARPGIASAEPDRATLEETERHAMLFQLVDRLPEMQFRVIHLRFVEQKSIREIAQELGRSEGAVKQLQFRAIESLREQMEGAHA